MEIFEKPNWEIWDKLEDIKALDIFENNYGKGDDEGKEVGAWCHEQDSMKP